MDASERENISRDELFEQLYRQLKQQAQRQMLGERVGHTLSATALVNEAWLRLGKSPDGCQSRAQFFWAASTAMRRILVEHARHRGAISRGGGWQRVTLGAQDRQTDLDLAELLALEDALGRLAEEDQRAARAIQLRYFAGLNSEEIAVLLGISAPTVRSDIAFARKYISVVMQDEDKAKNHPQN